MRCAAWSARSPEVARRPRRASPRRRATSRAGGRRAARSPGRRGRAGAPRRGGGAPRALRRARWRGCPARSFRRSSERLAAVGAAAVELRRPALVEPPTLLRPRRLARPFRPLVDTYGAARYADLDPTPVRRRLVRVHVRDDVRRRRRTASCSRRSGLLLRRSRSARLAARCARCGRSPWRAAWPRPRSASSTARRSARPASCRPSGWRRSTSRSGCSRSAVGGRCAAAGRQLRDGHRQPLARGRAPGGAAGALGDRRVRGVRRRRAARRSGSTWAWHARDSPAGSRSSSAARSCSSPASPPTRASRAPRSPQALVEVFDAVVRVGANLISFTRLAAFGLMHAALGAVVLDGARGLWGAGADGRARRRSLVFVVGNAAAFALEALVAGVQAMRLEYYELFSRLFAGRGRAVLTVEDPRGPEGPADMSASLLAAAPIAAARSASPAWLGAARATRVRCAAWSRSTSRSRCSARRRRRPRWHSASSIPPRRPGAAAGDRLRLGVHRRRDRDRRLDDRRRDRGRLHGRGGAGGDQREARAVRPGDGDRRARRGHRDLRTRDRGRAHRQDVSAAAAIGEHVRRRRLRAGRRRRSTPAEDAAAARAAWERLPADVACLILTPGRARGARTRASPSGPSLVWAVMPE